MKELKDLQIGDQLYGYSHNGRFIVGVVSRISVHTLACKSNGMIWESSVISDYEQEKWKGHSLSFACDGMLATFFTDISEMKEMIQNRIDIATSELVKYNNIMDELKQYINN